ncbi:T9SS type A sorting domain-containing protein [Spirosoma luteum]|uniref:T9SS type A sorting domain-containing protein n=1 Tax=Spirosoma luteum TaxID=431553 RepID=UPI00036ADEE6|nr:T9SS type A sorting domain-containing protein [Spirosoma luteum]
MKTVLLLVLVLFSMGMAQASHLLGGYIRATPVSGSSLTYQISAVLYLDEVTGKTATNQTDAIQICLGDGTTATAYRASRMILTNQTTSINSYTLIHTYVGPGTYTLTTSVSNRTPNKVIPNAENLLLTLNTTFTTNTTAANQTPAAGFPPTSFRIGVNSRAVLSLKATDAEGDSLVYGLAKPLTTLSISQSCTAQVIPTYQYPNDITKRGTFKVNSTTGDLVWDSPVEVGLYSVALNISEYRTGVLISQTTQEITLFVDDLPGTPGVSPPYEPAIQGVGGGLVMATTSYADTDFLLTTFPSPVDDQLQVVIQTSNLTSPMVEMTDINGRILHKLIFNRLARQHEQVIGMGSMTPGVYILRVSIGERSISRKIVKR